MLLKCDRINTSADAKYGPGLRPHSALALFHERPGDANKGPVKPAERQEFCCTCCAYVRTLAQGRQDGKKT